MFLNRCRSPLVFVVTPLLSMSGSVHAQVLVGPSKQVNPHPPGAEQQNWRECTVVARMGNANEVVVAAQTATESQQVVFGVSLTGGLSFQNGSFGFGVDSHLVLDRAYDRIWFS